MRELFHGAFGDVNLKTVLINIAVSNFPVLGVEFSEVPAFHMMRGLFTKAVHI